MRNHGKPPDTTGIEAELRPLLEHASDANPVWRGMLLLLDHQIEVKLEGVCNPSDMMANFQRGELAALREFRLRLVALRGKALAK